MSHNVMLNEVKHLTATHCNDDEMLLFGQGD
jgi:hypothetical protein